MRHGQAWEGIAALHAACAGDGVERMSRESSLHWTGCTLAGNCTCLCIGLVVLDEVLHNSLYCMESDFGCRQLSVDA